MPTYTEAIWLEAIGRKFEKSYGDRPGSMFGSTSTPWDQEFSNRKAGKVVGDLAAQVAADTSPLTPVRLGYMILAGHNYVAVQLDIAARYGALLTSGGGFNEGWNAALGEVRVPARK